MPFHLAIRNHGSSGWVFWSESNAYKGDQRRSHSATSDEAAGLPGSDATDRWLVGNTKSKLNAATKALTAMSKAAVRPLRQILVLHGFVRLPEDMKELVEETFRAKDSVINRLHGCSKLFRHPEK